MTNAIIQAETNDADVRWMFSFRPFLHFTESQLRHTDNPYYRHVLEYLANALRQEPSLLEPSHLMPDAAAGATMMNLLELSQAVNFSESAQPVWGIGLMNPMQFTGRSPLFAQLLTDSACNLRPELQTQAVHDEHRRLQYRSVLSGCYGHAFASAGREQILLRIAGDHGITRYYHLHVNNRFINMHGPELLPPLRQEWIDFAGGGLDMHEEELTVPLPLGSFTAEGFLIFTIIEATTEEALASLSAAIADMHNVPPEDTLTTLSDATRSLLADDSCGIGIMPFVKINGRPVSHELFRKSSILLRHCSPALPVESLYQLFRNRVMTHGGRSGPLLYNHATGRRYSSLFQKYFNNEFRSLALFPVWSHDELLGIVELVSAGEIDTVLLQKMERVLPAYKEMLVYRLGQLEDRIDRFILNRYTAVHPAVQWKFTEAAWHQLSNEQDDPAHTEEAPEIIFKELHPFYGTVDVRNSSLLRQQAVHEDFTRQLHALDTVLREAGGNGALYYPADTPANIGRWLIRLKTPLHLDDEEDLQALLSQGPGWVRALRLAGLPDAETADGYLAAMGDETSVYYASGTAYEQSLQRINTVLEQQLLAAENALQNTLPHYFEYFKTDGLEYNIYAGATIAPWLAFPEDALTAVSRWQVMTLIDMALAAHREQALIAHPLQTTQLLFAHATPIAIRFRTGEHRFDADGAYSIRYEVIKKRIDKVHLLYSAERLTQPGTIAVVYASAAVAALYEPHLAGEIAAGRLLPDIEHLELEPLQGITGLRAMRVRIHLPE